MAEHGAGLRADLSAAAYRGFFSRPDTTFDQLALAGATDNEDERHTPPELFTALDTEFGFTLDAAATAANALCPRYFAPPQDGLAESWESERVWCNPPFTNIAPWVKKAWLARAELVAMILPANRTEQRWWQELVEPFRDCGEGLAARFLKGRIDFGNPRNPTTGGSPFGCVLLIWDDRPTRSEQSLEGAAVNGLTPVGQEDAP